MLISSHDHGASCARTATCITGVDACAVDWRGREVLEEADNCQHHEEEVQSKVLIRRISHLPLQEPGDIFPYQLAQNESLA